MYARVLINKNVSVREGALSFPHAHTATNKVIGEGEACGPRADKRTIFSGIRATLDQNSTRKF